MPKILSIYPGIGIARLGDSQSDFFLAPEVPGAGPLELTADDRVTPITAQRDGDGRLRRQGVRFRVLEVETDAAGTVVGTREITAADAQIEWHVEIAHEKAAAGRFISETNPESTTKRNPGVAGDQLIIRPTCPPIAGADQTVTASSPGRFKASDVYLGELRTDHQGRLIVLGGLGVSASVPEGQPIGDEANTTNNNFANNEGWHDDVSDGPVSATVTFPGEAPVRIEDGWVIVAPPDFAPYTRGLSTMYDIAFDAAVRRGWLSVPANPSFKRDILPILKAISDYRFVSDFPFWENFPRDWLALGSIANQTLREQTRSDMESIEDILVAHFTFTASQNEVLDKWVSGDFLEDLDSPEPPLAITPDGLQRAALEHGVGGGFFPGIEAGILITYRELYGAPFRIRRDSFQRGTRTYQPRAGLLTRNMACPWQADFWECKYQGPESIWWPAQRPLHVRVNGGGGTVSEEWDRGVGDHRELCERVLRLGFVMPQDGASPMLVEKERMLH